MKQTLLLAPLAFVAICAAFSAVHATEVEFYSCHSEENPPAENCTVREVRIDPCLKEPCKVKRGKDVTISFDFTPTFEAATLENDVYWASPEGDLPWEGLVKNACDFVPCPLKKDAENTFSYLLTVDKLAPPVSKLVSRD